MTLPQQRLSITFAPATVFDEELQGRQARACMDLPGTSEDGVDTSLPPGYGVTVTGTEQIAAFRDCAEKIEGAVVREVGISRPGVVATEPALTDEQQAFIDSCVGQENALHAPGLAGRAEADVMRSDSLNPIQKRVVGRDGECLARTRDRVNSRFNLIVDRGKVIWAGRF